MGRRTGVKAPAFACPDHPVSSFSSPPNHLRAGGLFLQKHFTSGSLALHIGYPNHFTSGTLFPQKHFTSGTPISIYLFSYKNHISPEGCGYFGSRITLNPSLPIRAIGKAPNRYSNTLTFHRQGRASIPFSKLCSPSAHRLVSNRAIGKRNSHGCGPS